MITKAKVKKALKRAYDQAWRDEPCWEMRKVAGKAAKKAVLNFIKKELIK